MNVATGTTLVELLARSQLLSEEELAKAKGRWQEVVRTGQEPPAEELAARWVQAQLITRWQAEQLLTGRSEFFLGKYKLLEKLGQGGMGAVYKAQQVGLQRVVALKVMSDNVARQPGAVARFEREMRAVAALSHPCIVAAYDADHVGAAPFLVMEYVTGRDLGVWLKEFGRLPIDWSCECIYQAALGLQHAHEVGLAHRDIKPSNLLVVDGDLGGAPRIKILDMGLARFTSEIQCTVLTKTGQVLGTIDYISPEQAKDTKSADIRADIFSLGATLYHLVTGSAPYTGRNPVEKLMARALRDAPPARLLRPDLPLELEAIIARMLRRNPVERFQTPGELASALAPFTMSAGSPSDESSQLRLPSLGTGVGSTVHADIAPTLQAFLGSLSAGAREMDTPDGGRLADTLLPEEFASPAIANPTIAESPASQKRRRPPALWIAAGIAVGVLVIIAAAMLLRGGRTDIEVPVPVADGKATLPAAAQFDRLLEDAAKANKGADKAALAWAVSALRDFHTKHQNGDAAHRELAIRALSEAERLSPSPAGPTAAAVRADGLIELPTRTLWVNEKLQTTALSPDGTLLAAIAKDGEGLKLLRWNLKTDRELPAVPTARKDPQSSSSLGFSPDGRHVVSTYHFGSGADFFSAETGQLTENLPPNSRLNLYDVSFSPDGSHMALAAVDGSAYLWDLKNRRQLAALPHAEGTHGVTSVRLLRGAQQLITIRGTVDKLNIARIWDLSKGEVQTTIPRLNRHHPPVSPDEKLAAFWDDQKQIIFWDLVEHRELRRTSPTGSPLAISPDGRWLAVDNFRILDIAAGQGKAVASLTSGNSSFAEFAPDGKTVYFHKIGGEIRIVDLAPLLNEPDSDSEFVETKPGLLSTPPTVPGLLSTPLTHPQLGRWNLETVAPRGEIRSLAVSPNGKAVAVGSADGRIRIYDLESDELLRIIAGHDTPIDTLTWGGEFIISGSERAAALWHESGRLLDHWTNGQAAAITRDGRLAANMLSEVRDSRNATIRIFDPATRKSLFELTVPEAHVPKLQFSPDGKFLAARLLGETETVRLWSLPDGKPAGELQPQHHKKLLDFAWSPDATHIAMSTGAGAEVSTREGRRVMENKLHGGSNNVTFAPDGGSIAVTSSHFKKTVRCYLNGAPVIEARALGDAFPSALAFVDGQQMLVGDTAGRVVRQQSSDLAVIRTMVAGVSPNRGIAWRHDAGEWASIHEDGTLRRWDAIGRLQWASAPEKSPLVSVDYSTTGRIATAAYHGEVKIWNTDGSAQTVSIRAAYNSTVSWRSDGKRLVALGTNESPLMIVDENGQLVTDSNPPLNRGFFLAAFAPTGVKLAAGGNSGLNVFHNDPTSNQPPLFLDCGEKPMAWAWSPDGTRIATHAGAGQLIVFDARDGKQLRSEKLPKWNALAWNNDQSRLAIKQTNVTIYNSASLKKLSEIADSRHIVSLAWGPSEILIGGSYTGTLHAWRSNRTLSWIAIPFADRTSATITPDGRIAHFRQAGQHLVYLVERKDGSLEQLSIKEFNARTGDGG